ncbi:peroxiredoxin-like family protein [Duganella callida]|uniref:thioredoxin-dependent peroxiredoxin n=1 Tax=Duganella callida TaxID=2561932 RepID=A0A4Y9SDN9_9BURK|nr:peroxiredoxin-like family protein [Duganella callida]TFW18675.1 AhpC/TSA family protein [Duganella callida]
MRLDEQLPAGEGPVATGCTGEVPFDALRHALRNVIDPGGLDKALSAGARAPSFVLRDTSGKDVALEQLLRKGHVVITFYRGIWCPFCNADLQELNLFRHEILAREAQVVAVSQQTVEYSRKTQRLNKLRFPVLSDVSGLVTQAYGVQWTIPDNLRSVVLSAGGNIPCFSGDTSWSLPMSARYVVSRDGIISYAEVSADPEKRSRASGVLAILDGLNVAG